MENSSLSEVSELERQINELTKKREEILTQKRAQTLEEIKQAIKQFGFSWEELGYVKKTRSASAVSGESSSVTWYQNPDNANQIYKGKGPKPLWFKAYLDKNGKKEDIIYKK